MEDGDHLKHLFKFKSLGYLPKKLGTLVTYAHCMQITHSLVCGNPQSFANEHISKFDQPNNKNYTTRDGSHLKISGTHRKWNSTPNPQDGFHYREIGMPAGFHNRKRHNTHIPRAASSSRVVRKNSTPVPEIWDLRGPSLLENTISVAPEATISACTQQLKIPEKRRSSSSYKFTTLADLNSPCTPNSASTIRTETGRF